MHWTEVLKAKIAEEAAHLGMEEEDWEAPAPRVSLGSPAEKPEGVWHRRDFLAYPAEEFLQAAYRRLLGRDPDPSGEAAYAPYCASWLGRVAVLGHLAASPEGRARGVQVRGVGGWRWWHAVALRLPGAKRWLGIADWVLRLLDLAAWQELDGRAWRSLGAGLQAQEAALRRQAEALAEQEATLRRQEDSLRLLQSAVGQTERRLSALLEAPEPKAQIAAHEKMEAFYLAFEDACRGKEEEIIGKLEGYLPRLKEVGDGLIVDLGCGRGEWLKLLERSGFTALGVETSPAMLEHCLSQGLNVVAADAVEWLKAQPEGSLSAVTAFHVLEHLPFAALLELVQAAHHALRAGGIAIFETPNPENVLVGSHTFYHDPTHRHPLTPTLLEFVLNYVGFSRVVIERLNPYPPQAKVPGDGTLVERVNGHFYGPQDFAAIGYK
jgi:SAM-dependent methyltransferase